MFTGIIEEIGIVGRVVPGSTCGEIFIRAASVYTDENSRLAVRRLFLQIYLTCVGSA